MNKKIKDVIIPIFVVILIIALCVSFSQIEKMKHEIYNLRTSLSNNVDTIQNNIDDIYNNVDEKLKKEASFLSDYIITYGNLNINDFTTPLLVTVTPKISSDDTVITVTIDGKTVTLNRNGEVFSGYIDTYVFLENETLPLISIFDDDNVKNEYLEENFNNLFTQFLPQLSSQMTIEQEKFSNGKIKIVGDLMVDNYKVSAECTATFERYFITAEKSGREIFRKDISLAVEKANGEMCSINDSFSADSSDDIEYYIIATDTYGLTHKTRILCNYVGKIDSMTSYIDEVDVWGLIYDKNGNLLYGK